MPSLFSKSAIWAAGIACLSTALALPTELVVYYGQGPNQVRLREYCDYSSIDIIPVGFVTKFANTGTGGVIETNFGNQCYAPVSPGTNFVYNCPELAEDILYCQTTRNKKILLSIGGGAPHNSYYLSTEAEALQAVEDIWAVFGPVDPSWTRGRPFGDAVVDGFDFDLETGANGDGGAMYAFFAQALRDKAATDASKTYLFGAAPQCIYPDATIGKILTDVALDYIFVQFYNNPSCRPANLVHGDRSAQETNFQQWNTLAGSNPGGSTKWYLGLLAQPASADYTNQQDLVEILEYIQPLSNFGGIMLWEATYAANDVNANGNNYIEQVKLNLNGTPDIITTTTTTSHTPTSTPTPFATTFPEPPAQTQPGVNPNCNLWRLVQSGDNCEVIAQGVGNGVTAQDIIAWNPAVGAQCTNLWLSYYACVGVSSTSTTTSSTTSTTSVSTGSPTATQEGFPENCLTWAYPKSGDWCAKFADDNGIDLQTLFDLNPILGQDGAGCSTLFWLGVAYCLSVPSVTSTSTITQTSTSSTASSTLTLTTSSSTTLSSTLTTTTASSSTTSHSPSDTTTGFPTFSHIYNTTSTSSSSSSFPTYSLPSNQTVTYGEPYYPNPTTRPYATIDATYVTAEPYATTTTTHGYNYWGYGTSKTVTTSCTRTFLTKTRKIESTSTTSTNTHKGYADPSYLEPHATPSYWNPPHKVVTSIEPPVYVPVQVHTTKAAEAVTTSSCKETPTPHYQRLPVSSAPSYDDDSIETYQTILPTATTPPVYTGDARQLGVGGMAVVILVAMIAQIL